jgi:hypothetical protein
MQAHFFDKPNKLSENKFLTHLSPVFSRSISNFSNRIHAVAHLRLSFFHFRTTMTASSHPPMAEKPSSHSPSPQRHAFLTSLPLFCSAGASVGSSAASICNCHHANADMFCVRAIDPSTQHSRARDPPSLCSSHLFYAFSSPLSRLCSARTPFGSTHLQ